jgi:HK97 gp10 family phage protein
MSANSSRVYVENNVNEVLHSVETGVVKWVRDMTARLELETVNELNRLVYNTPESPNYQRTGNLRKSVQKHFPTETEGVVQVGGGQVDYAKAVHEGTQHMPPRPYMRNAVEKLRNEAGPDLARQIEAQL